MYAFVEYVTCVVVAGGFVALVLVGWLLLIEVNEGVKRLAKREGAPELRGLARLDESPEPTPFASLAVHDSIPALHIHNDPQSRGVICPLPPQH